MKTEKGRRAFLRSSLAGGLAAAVAPVMRMESVEARERPESLPGVPTFEFEEITIAELQEGMKAGKYTARAIAEKYLARIEALDKHGPAVNSVIELNPDALALAEASDRERKEKGARGPLHGIPVLIKDNIDTADKMMTTAGSLALVGSKPPKDSTAAVSANFCAAAIGTETDGSIVCPSSANGLVGIKPTVGLVSRRGIVPISHSQDGAGPMCRTVRDAATVLGALTGVDSEDRATAESQGKSFTDYTQFLKADGLRGARIGVVRKTLGFMDAVDKVMEAALEAMKKEGAILVDPVEIETAGKWSETESTVFMYELKADLNAYLARPGFNPPVKTLKDIIEFNEKNREKEMPYFGQDFFLKAEAKGPLSDKEYIEALEKNHQLARKEGIDATIDKHNLDALVGPTGGPAWLTDLIDGDHFGGGSSGAAAVAGYPNVTVPAGFVFGMPVGISFFGRAWSEPVLIRLAYAFEQATKVRKAPKFLPSVNLHG